MSLLPSPAEEAQAARLRQQAEVTSHLLALPGVESASVVIAEAPATLPRFDEPPPAGRKVSVVLVTTQPVTDIAPLVAAAVPGVAPADVTVRMVTATPKATLRHVGPFEVAPASFAPLLGTLATLLVLVLLLGGLLFRSERTRQPKLADPR